MFQIEITAIIGAALFFVTWCVRLESRVNQGEDKIRSLEAQRREDKAAHEVELEKMRADHDTELRILRDSNNSKDRVVWEKIDSLHAILTDVLKSLGRLEGKMENRN